MGFSPEVISAISERDITIGKVPATEPEILLHWHILRLVNLI